MTKEWGLNEKQKNFAQEYIKDFSINDAAQRSRYSVATAKVLLNNSQMQAYLSALIQERNAQRELESKENPIYNVSKENILEELARLAFSDITNLLTFDRGGVQFKTSDELDANTTRSISSISSHTVHHADGGSTTTMKVSLHDKHKALAKLGEYIGLFNDFNQAVACLAKYGLKLYLNEKGSWSVTDENQQTKSTSGASLQQRLKALLEEEGETAGS